MDRRGRVLVDMVLNKQQSMSENDSAVMCNEGEQSPCPEIVDKDPIVLAQLMDDLDNQSAEPSSTEWHLTDSVVSKYLDQPLDSLPSPFSSIPASIQSSEQCESPGDILVLVGTPSTSNCASVENETDFSPCSDNDPTYNPQLDKEHSSDLSECDRTEIFDPPSPDLTLLQKSLSDTDVTMTYLNESTGILTNNLSVNCEDQSETICQLDNSNMIQDNNTNLTDSNEIMYLDETTGILRTDVPENSNLPNSLDEDVPPATTTTQGRPKRGRKAKYENRHLNKVNRNSNRTYYNYKHKKIEPKVFTNSKCNCKEKCHEKISPELRNNEFQRFWGLGSYDAQTVYIISKIKQTSTRKTKKSSATDVKKHFVRQYKIGDTAVCKNYFLKTYQISSCRVNTALQKNNSGKSMTCMRGIKQGGANKIEQNKEQSVIEFIKKIPTYESHYCRNKTDAKFLPPDMTLTKLIDKYKEEYKDSAVSDAIFKRIFYSKFNLRTAPLKKDTCNFCDSIKAKMANERIQSKKEELKKQHEEHLKLAEEAQNNLKEDLKRAKEDETLECYTFDMEKTLPLPRISTNVVFYKRQLWLYNEGVYSGKTEKGYCYIWVEGEAGKGAQEVGSVLKKHIKEELPRTVKNLILWSDSCGGQNRNIKITLLLKTVLEEIPNLETITIKFLLSGHSFLPNDRHFATIETALKHVQRVYLPDDYIAVMKGAKRKNPLTVKRMENGDFQSTRLLENHITNRKFGINREKISWLHTRQISFDRKEPYKFQMKESFKLEEQGITVDLQPKHKPPELFLNLLAPLWPEGKPISLPKLKDLASLLPLLPSDSQQFYLNLQSGPSVTDDIEGFGVAELDFEYDSN